MPSHDDEHFDDYPAQTQAKHSILTAYLPAYLKALKNRVARFHYIDGFAGRGYYAETQPGSPLLALDVLRSESCGRRTSVSFVEDNPAFFNELVDAVSAHAALPDLFSQPLVRQGSFAQHIDEILDSATYHEQGSVATFSFVDPCGIAGVRMVDLVRLLDLDFGEVLLLLNYDGLNRIVGGVEAGTQGKDILVDLLGASDLVESLLAELQHVETPGDRELRIRDCFVSALRSQSDVKYLVPFRFDAKRRTRTSHYLLHCCNNCLPFAIMKHVMWETGRDATNPYGRLEFLNDRERGRQFQLFHTDIDQQKERIVAHLRGSPAKVSRFTVDWVCRPSDLFSERAYRTMLQELEASRRVEVFDKQNRNPAPERRRIHGELTLGRDYWLRSP